MDNAFWADQHVLLTGATGFLGKHIARLMNEHDTFWSGPLSGDVDLRDSRSVYAHWYQVARNSILIHCAANVGGIGKNRERPAEIMYDNLLMNTHVLHEAYRAGVQKFVGIGSVCAYPKHTPVPFSEDDLFNGYPEETNAPYGLTKRALLVMGQAYRQQYGFNAIHLMLANLYGPGDNFDPDSSHVIPAIMRKMHEAKLNGTPSITLWGTGNATREFLYVEDAVAAIIQATETYNEPEPLNIGTGHSIHIAKLAALIAEVVGYTGNIVFNPDMPDGQPQRQLDVSRAERALDWTAQTALADGLQMTYDWYVAEVVGV